MIDPFSNCEGAEKDAKSQIPTKPTPFPIFHKDLSIWLRNVFEAGQKIVTDDKKMSNLLNMRTAIDRLIHKAKNKYLDI